MRTTLDLSDELMRALVARHPSESKTKAVERAIEAYLQRDSVDELLRRAGSFDIEDVSQDMRRRDREV